MNKVYEAIKFSSQLVSINDFRKMIKFSLVELNMFLDSEKVNILFYEKNIKNDEIFYIINEDSQMNSEETENNKLFYRFPFIGLSSEVVREKKVIVLKDNPRSEKNYLDDIDNLSGLVSLKNLTLGPIT